MIAAYDSIDAWTSEPTQMGFDYADPDLVGAVPTVIRQGEGVPMVRSFIGLKEFVGWRFTMTPAQAPDGIGFNGSQGFMRAETRRSDGSIAEYLAAAARADEEDVPELATHFRLQAETPRAPEWFEGNWLTQWLKNGLIREVTGG